MEIGKLVGKKNLRSFSFRVVTCHSKFSVTHLSLDDDTLDIYVSVNCVDCLGNSFVFYLEV